MVVCKRRKSNGEPARLSLLCEKHNPENAILFAELGKRTKGENMPNAFADFYKSTAWQRTRQAYGASRGWLCERCLARGVHTVGDTIHHKTHLTAENISDPALSLGWDNLVLLCRDCHAEEHRNAKRYRLDPSGRVIW